MSAPRPARTPGRVVAARQEALGERAVGDDHAAVSLRPQDQLALGAAREERVLDLVEEHAPAELLLGPLPASEVEVAHAHLGHHAGVHQFAQPAHGLAQRHDRVGPVDLVEVDPIHAEAAGGGPGAVADHRGHRHQGEELGRQHHVGAPLAQRGAEDAFARPEAIDLGGVEERDAELQRAADHPSRLLVRVVLAVAPLTRAELPRAEPDLGDRRLQALDRDAAHLRHAPPLEVKASHKVDKANIRGWRRRSAGVPPRVPARGTIETALALIAERGPQGFSPGEPPRGVSVSAPYRHFADRDELLAAVATEAYAEVRRRLAAAVASAEDPAEQLARAAAAYVRFAAERRAMFSVLWEAGLDKRRHPALQRAAEETWETIARPAPPGAADERPGRGGDHGGGGRGRRHADGQFGASAEAAEAARAAPPRRSGRSCGVGACSAAEALRTDAPRALVRGGASSCGGCL